MYDFISDKEDPDKAFDLIEKIGKGNYGVVYKALHKKSSKIVAAKVANLGGELEAFKKEISVLSQCNSPFIVSYLGSYIKNYCIWIILEYCDGGSLLDLIHIQEKHLNEEQIASIVAMLLQGLSYLHENKKIHRDVKTGNILLTREGMAKLGDFGVSTQLHHSFSKKVSKAGTPFYMSPEVICQNNYNFKCDIWSLGITCIEMAEGQPPYYKTKPYLVLKKILKEPPKGLSQREEWSEEFNDFVSQCLIWEPDSRPSAKELLMHPFIQLKNKGEKSISELVTTSFDALVCYRKEQFKSDNYDDEDDDNEADAEEKYNEVGYNYDQDHNYNCDDNNQAQNVIGIQLMNSSMIIKEINEEQNEETETMIKQSNENNFMNMIDIYDGIQDLNFDQTQGQCQSQNHSQGLSQNSNSVHNNQSHDSFSKSMHRKSIPLQKIRSDKTLMTEETRNYEMRVQEYENNKHSSETSEIMLSGLIDDPTLNLLSPSEIGESINQLKQEMNSEIDRITKQYNQRIAKYVKSLEFLKQNQFLKNLNEYREFQKFANKISKKRPIATSGSNKDSTFLSNSVYTKNNILVYDYKDNNISLKNKYGIVNN